MRLPALALVACLTACAPLSLDSKALRAELGERPPFEAYDAAETLVRDVGAEGTLVGMPGPRGHYGPEGDARFGWTVEVHTVPRDPSPWRVFYVEGRPVAIVDPSGKLVREMNGGGVPESELELEPWRAQRNRFQTIYVYTY